MKLRAVQGRASSGFQPLAVATARFARKQESGGHRRLRLLCSMQSEDLDMLITSSANSLHPRKGHSRLLSAATFSASCSLIVPSNSQVRVETEFETRGVGREQRVSRVLFLRIRTHPAEYAATSNDTS
jgi:hypothetical protein